MADGVRPTGRNDHNWNAELAVIYFSGVSFAGSLHVFSRTIVAGESMLRKEDDEEHRIVREEVE